MFAHLAAPSVLRNEPNGNALRNPSPAWREARKTPARRRAPAVSNSCLAEQHPRIAGRHLRGRRAGVGPGLGSFAHVRGDPCPLRLGVMSDRRHRRRRERKVPPTRRARGRACVSVKPCPEVAADRYGVDPCVQRYRERAPTPRSARRCAPCEAFELAHVLDHEPFGSRRDDALAFPATHGADRGLERRAHEIGQLPA